MTLDFAIAGLRLFGIYFIVESIPLLGEGGLLFVNSKFSEPAIHSLTPIWVFTLSVGILEAVLGILLLKFSKPLARRAISSVPDESKKTACSTEDIQTMAFAVAGLLIIALALPGLGWASHNLYEWIRYKEGGPVPSSDTIIHSTLHAFGVFAQLVLGLFLLLNPRGFRNAWHWLRTAGTQPTNPGQ